MMKEKFAESVFLSGVPEKLGGAICLQVMTLQSATATRGGYSNFCGGGILGKIALFG